MNPNEKRKSVRVPVQMDIQIERQQHTIPGTMLNCSIDGMFIRTTEMIPDNEVVKIHFILPGNQQKMLLRSRTIWCHSLESTGAPILGLGVRFDQLTAEQTEALRQFIDQILNS